MNEEQAILWLMNNDFYTEGDTGSECPEATLFVDPEHVEIVMKLSEEKKL